MNNFRKVLVAIGLGTIVTVAGCAPSEEKKAPAATDKPKAAAAPAAATPAPAKPASATPAPASPGGVAAMQTANAAPAAAPAKAVDAEGGAPKAAPVADDANAPFGDDKLLAGLVPQGWKQAGPIENYNVAALYNKINGRSDLYNSYDVHGLSWVSFVQESDKDNFLDLFVYDMRAPKNAFGIFSVEREPGQPKSEFGRMSYQTGSNYYFFQGNYYGYVNASRVNDANTKAGKDILGVLIKRLSDSGEAITGMDWLPKEGLIEDTIQYFKKDALSLDFLTDTFVGQYPLGDKKVRVFVSHRKDDAEAAMLQTSFGEYAKNYAGGTGHITVDGVDITTADWGSAFDGAFHLGSVFAGVSNAAGKDTLNDALAMLIKQLKAQK